MKILQIHDIAHSFHFHGMMHKKTTAAYLHHPPLHKLTQSTNSLQKQYSRQNRRNTYRLFSAPLRFFRLIAHIFSD